MMANRTVGAGLLVVLGLTASAQAQTALSSLRSVPVRSGPGRSYAAIGQMGSAGLGCAGIARLRNAAGEYWWKIQFDGREGYTRADRWQAVAGRMGVKVIQTQINLRTGPGTSYALAGTARLNQVFCQSAQSSGGSTALTAGWYKIWFGGMACWVPGTGVAAIPLAGVYGPAAATAAEIDMVPYWKKQETHYWCGPATAQMMIKYLAGRYDVTQTQLANRMNTTKSGTSYGATYRELNEVLAESGLAPFQFRATFDRSLIVRNIGRSEAVTMIFNLRFIPYSGSSTVNHYSAIRGYTAEGFLIADVFYGPRKYATTTQLRNACTYASGRPLQTRYQ